MKIILFMLASLLVFSGCKPDESVVAINADQLAGNWQLVDNSSYDVTLVIARGFQTWERLPDKLFNVSGNSSVNTYSSTLSYEADDQPQIAIGPITSTKKGGSSEAMQFEQTYFANLRAVNRYELTNQNRLRLYYNGAQTGVLVYERM